MRVLVNISHFLQILRHSARLPCAFSAQRRDVAAAQHAALGLVIALG
jgi:hypothetical protein